MGVKGEKEASGLYVIRLSGVFTNQERRAMEAAGRAVIDRNSKIRILILAEDKISNLKEAIVAGDAKLENGWMFFSKTGLYGPAIAIAL